MAEDIGALRQEPELHELEPGQQLVQALLSLKEEVHNRSGLPQNIDISGVRLHRQADPQQEVVPSHTLDIVFGSPDQEDGEISVVHNPGRHSTVLKLKSSGSLEKGWQGQVGNPEPTERADFFLATLPEFSGAEAEITIRVPKIEAVYPNEIP